MRSLFAILAVLGMLLLCHYIRLRGEVALGGVLCGGWLSIALLEASINVAKISVGLDDVADSVLQFFRFRKATIKLAVPDHCVCDIG